MLSSLKEPLTRYMDAHGGGDSFFATEIPPLTVMRSSQQTMPHHVIYRPALCVIVQGAKQVMLGDDVFHYGVGQSLVVSVELPLLGGITQATPSEPYLGLTVDFDVAVLREVMEQLDDPPRPTGDLGLGLFVDDLGGPLADSVVRLVKLLETPRAIPILYPAIMREIYFWLLTGPHGGEVCKLALPSSHTRRLTRAIQVLRDDFARPIRIGQLAEEARMSPSSFHQHFKTLTSMTPLQYQKQLRLLEARRLMAAGEAGATSAAYQVGYESPSQFSREYSRMFGAPPRRDVAERRKAAA